MKRSIWKIVVVSLVLILIGHVAFSAEAREREERVVIRWATFQPRGTILVDGVEMFKEVVERNSGGEIEVQIFPDGQLGGQRELLESARAGSIHMTYGNSPTLSNYLPEFALLDLPYMFDDYGHIERAVFGDVGSLFNERLVEKTGLRIMSWNHVGFRDMLTRDTKIQSIEDFRGVRFRSPEAFAYLRMFNALGAIPTPLPWPEVYQAMRTRVVDGLETITEAVIPNNLHEVAKYLIVTQHINTVEVPVVNESFFQGLSERHQNIIIESFAEVAEWQNPAQIAANEAAYEKLEEMGMEIIFIDREPLTQACEAVWEEYSREVPEAEQLIAKIDALR